MATSYGSITIVDITDVGEFSLYPTSNMPLTVIYSPDDNSYTPTWGSSGNSLILTPTLYYAGESVAPTASGVTVTWTKKIGTAAPSAVDPSAGETVSGGILTVTQNQFNTTTNLVTYICTGQYVEPETGQTLTAVGQITFTLVKNAATVKTCSITGPSIFKYSADQSTVTPATITLTANISNTVTHGNWQYLNSSNQFVNLPTVTGIRPSINGATVTIAATENDLFNDRVATIKKLTSDADTYDIVNITKLYDGVAGDSNVVMALTNDNQLIPCDANGSPTIQLSEITTEIKVYEGSDDTTSTWTGSVQLPTGIEGTLNQTTKVFTLSAWNSAAETASIVFQMSKTNQPTLSKTLNLTKVKTGTDGTSPIYYELVCPTIATNRNINKTFNPATVTFTAKRVEGNTKTNYRGYLKIYAIDTSAVRTLVGSGNMSDATTPPSFVYTFADPSASTTLANIEVEMYQTGGSGEVLDRQTIIVADDGQTGARGEGAYTIILGNSHETIACDSSGVVSSATRVEIPFTCYQGTSQAAATITNANIVGIPTGSGITPTIVRNATASTPGLIYLDFPATNLNGSSGSEITLTFTISGETVPMKFSWHKTLAGEAGDAAIILQCFAPQGDIIQNNVNDVILSTQLTEGSEVIASTSATYQWYKYSSTSTATDKYDVISGETNATLTVHPNMVDGYASFKCVATYPSGSAHTYTAYAAVRDKSDPLQVEVFSSLGQQLVNGAGYGAVYARIYLNGQEVDQIKTTEFVTATSQATGTRCYLLNTNAKTCTYMVKTGNQWSTGTEGYTGTYRWTFRDKNGNAVNYNQSAYHLGKVLYVDGSLIDSKIIFDVEASYGA